MAVTRIPAAALALLAFALGQSSRAGNVNYNFNSGDGGWTVTSGTLTQPEQPWLWTPGPSVNEGGWQAWRGADAAQSGSYLVSPMFAIDDVDGTYVRMDIRHRFDFGGTGTAPLLALGQVQYSVNGGNWLGIRTADFLATSGKIPPDYLNPPFPFIDQTLAPPTGTYAVDAWFGTTLDFATGSHQDSQFSLDFPPYALAPGDLIRFRFLVSTQTPLSGTGAPVIDWEINKVQIDGVDISPVPEPGALALVGIAGCGCVLWIRRRRHTALRSAIDSTAATIVMAAVVGLVVAANAAKAQDPIVLIDNEYDFAKGPEGWTSQTFAYFSGTNTVSGLNAWTYLPSSDVWHVTPKSVLNEDYWIGNYLTSPVIEVAEAVDVLQLNIIHRYAFPINSSSGDPITSGQLAYRIFNAFQPDAPYQPFLPGSFASGTVPPPFDARTPFPTWDVPDRTAPSGLPPLLAGGLAWTGTSPGFATGDFVASRATLRNLVPGDRVEFRLINANLGRDCVGGAWDVTYVRVNGLFLPEPDGLFLAAGGGGALAMGWFVRRRRITTLPRCPT